jgi:drug/metabolite transporter (DMT)-like permease
MGGLAYLLWPSGTVAVSLGGSGLMALAAIGWGVYSLLGRGAGDPLRLTGENFICAAPVVGLVWLIWPDDVALFGAVLAVLSGVVTSGLGYALWYRVLPQLDASIAAIVQLSVPIFAVRGGMALLGEPVTLRFVIASALVLGGILISLIRRA